MCEVALTEFGSALTCCRMEDGCGAVMRPVEASLMEQEEN